jgi:hypothetical protein
MLLQKTAKRLECWVYSYAKVSLLKNATMEGWILPKFATRGKKKKISLSSVMR